MTTLLDPATDHPTVTATDATTWRRAMIVYASLAILLLLACREVVSDMVRVWYGTTTYNHGFLILPLVAFLIWLRVPRLKQLSVRAEPLALVPLAGLAALLLIGLLSGVNTVQQFALVTMLIVLAVLVFGREVSWELKFSLFFLLFLVPVGEFLVPSLQDITAHFSVALLRLLGIPTFHDGILIDIPNGRFVVAEACAGIRFLIANIVIAFLFAHLAYDRTWKWVVFMTMAVIVPIVANGLRAFGIIMIAHLTDNEYAVGVDHLVYGWGFFAVIMLLLLFVGNLFADRRAGDPPTSPVWRSAAPARPIGVGLIAVAVALVVAAPGYTAYVFGADHGATVASDPADLPPLAPDWMREDSPRTNWSPAFASADARYLTRYTNGADTVDVFIAYYTHQRPEHEVIYYANTFHDEEVWTRVETRGVVLDAGGGRTLPPAEFNRLSGPGRISRVVVSWYWTDGALSASKVDAKLGQLKTYLIGGRPEAAIIALSVPNAASGEDALATIERFLADSPPLDAYLAAIADATHR